MQLRHFRLVALLKEPWTVLQSVVFGTGDLQILQGCLAVRQYRLERFQRPCS
jgi:hypothetical protein